MCWSQGLGEKGVPWQELLSSNVPSKNVIKNSTNNKGKKHTSPDESYDEPGTPKWLHLDDVYMAEAGEAGERLQSFKCKM